MDLRIKSEGPGVIFSQYILFTPGCPGLTRASIDYGKMDARVEPEGPGVVFFPLNSPLSRGART
jgi:hypothetical protein